MNNEMRLTQIGALKTRVTTIRPIPNTRSAWNGACHHGTRANRRALATLPNCENIPENNSLLVFTAEGPYLTMSLLCEACAETRRRVYAKSVKNGTAANANKKTLDFVKEYDAWNVEKCSSRQSEKTKFLWIATEPGIYVADEETKCLYFLSRDGRVIDSLDISQGAKVNYAKVNSFAKQFCKEN